MASPLDDLGTSAGTIAGWATAIALAVLGAWRGYLQFRKDQRNDKADVRIERGVDYADAIYRKLLDSTKERLEAMDRAIEEVSQDYRAERQARLEAEDRAVTCERDRLMWEQARKAMLDGLADCERRSEALESRIAFLEKQQRPDSWR